MSRPVPPAGVAPEPGACYVPALYSAREGTVMWRSFVAVIGGVVIGGVVVAAVEAAGHAAYPPPEGIRSWTREQIAEWARSAPSAVFLFVLLAWAAGTFLGGAMAVRVAGQRAPRVHAGIVTAVFLLATAFNLVAIPSPLWFTIAGPLVVIAAGWGATLTDRRTTSS